MINNSKYSILGFSERNCNILAEKIFAKLRAGTYSHSAKKDSYTPLHLRLSNNISSLEIPDSDFLLILACIVNYGKKNNLTSFFSELTNAHSPITIEKNNADCMLNLVFLMRANLPERACEGVISNLLQFSEFEMGTLIDQIEKSCTVYTAKPKLEKPIPYDLDEVKRELKHELENNVNFYPMIYEYTNILLHKSQNEECRADRDFKTAAENYISVLKCHAKAVGSRICQDWVPIAGCVEPELAFSEHQQRLISKLFEANNSNGQDYIEGIYFFGDEMGFSFMLSELWKYLIELKKAA